jgi:hypothetical protein
MSRRSGGRANFSHALAMGHNSRPLFIPGNPLTGKLQRCCWGPAAVDRWKRVTFQTSHVDASEIKFDASSYAAQFRQTSAG